MNILSHSAYRAREASHPSLPCPKKERAIPPRPEGTGHPGAVLVIDEARQRGLCSLCRTWASSFNKSAYNSLLNGGRMWARAATPATIFVVLSWIKHSTQASLKHYEKSYEISKLINTRILPNEVKRHFKYLYSALISNYSRITLWMNITIYLTQGQYINLMTYLNGNRRGNGTTNEHWIG
jgi:hypothetical protein